MRLDYLIWNTGFVLVEFSLLLSLVHSGFHHFVLTISGRVYPNDGRIFYIMLSLTHGYGFQGTCKLIFDEMKPKLENHHGLSIFARESEV
jgi:hypothetical protein